MGFKIGIVAGERSGSIHAANLVTEIKNIVPKAEFFGLGGYEMRETGVEIMFDLTKFAIVGLVEPIKHIFELKKIMNDFIERIRQEKPNALILVDYPGFNLRLAKKLIGFKLPIIYYIAPQIWAWGRGRIENMRKTIKKVLVALQFEEEFYKKEGIDASFVGHPIIDLVKMPDNREDIIKRFNLKGYEPIIGLFPGSRPQEIKGLLPAMNETIENIKKNYPKARTILVKSESISKESIKRYNGDIVEEKAKYDVMRMADLLLLTSGTVTLEAAIIGTPFLIMYRVAPLTYFFAKHMVKVKFIGLPNIIAGKEIVPEFIQHKADAKFITESAISLLNDTFGKREKMQKELKEIAGKLGDPGVAKRAAKLVLKSIESMESIASMNTI